MLFNSYEYILYFLPITVFLFYFLTLKVNKASAIWMLVMASLFFYGWWNPYYLALIIASIIVNYRLGLILYRHRQRAVLAVGVGLNLGLLAYYKYANFFVDNINSVLDAGITLETIILPLAISFFTFQQIAYLVDCYRNETEEHQFSHYCLFVTFFPQLIAGPIVHHKDMLPQFVTEKKPLFSDRDISFGVTLFIIGLFKKVVLADGVAEFANPVFMAADNGESLHFMDAWGGALAYSLQLYFDFSGYADMAIGSARLFGIRLPLNFNSPYKSGSIIEFWRCWHMTLSRFLRDYVYIALGGNQKGKARRYVNLMTTMLLGGFWHGAGFNFIIWGGLHGLYLVINHGWHALRKSVGLSAEASTVPGRLLAFLITFFAVVLAWVVFRAETIHGAALMLSTMMGISAGENLTTPMLLDQTSVKWIIGLLGIVWLLPNSLEFMGVVEDRAPAAVRAQWKPSYFSALALLLVFTYTLMQMTEVSEFLYFQF